MSLLSTTKIKSISNTSQIYFREFAIIAIAEFVGRVTAILKSYPQQKKRINRNRFKHNN